MILELDSRLAVSYKSPSQRVRVMTEAWAATAVYCPNCQSPQIDQARSNSPVADYRCRSCSEEYELKSSKSTIKNTITDGAYKTMLERLASRNNPNLFVLCYDHQNLRVLDLLLVPKHFFTPDIIVRRNPLSTSAERSDWVGCNIRLSGVPESGRIYMVRRGAVIPKKEVRAAWNKTLFLREENQIEARGWLLDVMRCIDRLGGGEFDLSDVYRYEADLSRLHPHNRHIKDKIRQQLQILRDRKYLIFVGNGRYRAL